MAETEHDIREHRDGTRYCGPCEDRAIEDDAPEVDGGFYQSSLDCAYYAEERLAREAAAANTETIYKVERFPAASSRRPYYGTRNIRLYRNRNGVSQFTGASSAPHKVWRGQVVWEEIEV